MRLPIDSKQSSLYEMLALKHAHILNARHSGHYVSIYASIRADDCFWATQDSNPDSHRVDDPLSVRSDSSIATCDDVEASPARHAFELGLRHSVFALYSSNSPWIPPKTSSRRNSQAGLRTTLLTEDTMVSYTQSGLHFMRPSIC